MGVRVVVLGGSVGFNQTKYICQKSGRRIYSLLRVKLQIGTHRPHGHWLLVIVRYLLPWSAASTNISGLTHNMIMIMNIMIIQYVIQYISLCDNIIHIIMYDI